MERLYGQKSMAKKRQLGHSGPLGSDVDADVRSQRWCLPVGETPRATTSILSMPTHHVDDLDIYESEK